ncbi:Gtr1/RagA G protein conserved region-domain-containing protein [Tricharina praecox]|uniref:Gtr1/RagA G protein conserved region-domain-containing protein n=1 Tax=Tricharina praecox TaxID=43433 RepID=UPI00221F4D5C|nr:Gtr1/RagA G protein conserved region-domain-containing protein [Tricharina praecox]KAI5857513.1 Gtr1/RagA G protein conserved region-domain-containing protein [Tricharina praecox]
MSLEERKGNRNKKKVLLMGKSGSGKSSMRSIVFSNYVAKDTRRLGATIDVEHSHVRFLGNLTLNLWDCGGQDAFMENYLATQRDHIFKNVEVLIYVFDVESREFNRDLITYCSIIEALSQNSPDASVFCLIHKMDLVQAELRERLYQERSAVLRDKSLGMDITTFATSIWDETLYKAWAKIVYTLIPNLPQLEHHLTRFAELAEAEEVILFERTTFLVISHVTRAQEPNPYPDRFEKISNIVKQFKQSCTKMASNFIAFELRAHTFSAFIDVLTPNTYILVVMPANAAESATTLGNIAVARRHFEKLEKESGASAQGARWNGENGH